jgi:hypothetical protein
MNKFFKILSLLIIAGISASSFAQNKVYTMQAGSKTFMATSATATSFNWYLNGAIQASQTTSSFANTWSAGTYWLSAAGVSTSCAGDSFDIKVIVKADVTTSGPQLTWASTSPVTVCQPSNSSAGSSSTNVLINLTNYTLGTGETYSVILSLDGTLQAAVTGIGSATNAPVLLSLVGLTPGTHSLKLAKLFYGSSPQQIVDYTNATNTALAITLDVTAAPTISDIQ